MQKEEECVFRSAVDKVIHQPACTQHLTGRLCTGSLGCRVKGRAGSASSILATSVRAQTQDKPFQAPWTP